MYDLFNNYCREIFIFINMPTIKNKTIISSTDLFTIKKLDIEFKNNVHRKYEVVSGKGHGAVMIIPFEKNTFYFIKEFAAGINDYAISFPKGRIDDGESMFEAANRELQEEIGYKSDKLSHIFTLSLAPGYIDHDTHIILAQELSVSKLDGDEPEELEVIQCELSKVDTLIQEKKNNMESRAIACVYLFQNHINLKK